VKKKKEKDPLPHWNICLTCAEKKGGIPPSWPVTCMGGPCPYCGTPGTLIPISDFAWPKLSRKALWD
jgi:hypothetical protein